MTDRATFAYLMDVFVLEDYRGRGLGKWMMEVVMQHPDLQGLRKFMLATRDAHGLYESFSFARPKFPETILEIANWDVYKKA